MSTSIILLDPNDPSFDKSLAGASVSWELTDEVRHEDLCKALTDASIPCLPEPVSPASALHRLLSDLYQNRNRLVKPTKNPNGSKKSAYAVLPRQDDNGRMAFVETWSVGITSDDRNQVALVFSAGSPEDSAEEVSLLFPSALEMLGRTEQSVWLVTVVKNFLRGVPTIGGAGTYFIGPKEIKTWRSLRDLLKPFGIRLYEIPAMRSSEAIECVIESVKRYTEAAVRELDEEYKRYAEMQKRVDAGEEGARKIQQRALDTRLAKINDQLQVVEKYEALFETKLTELRDSLGNLQAGFSSLAIAST